MRSLVQAFIHYRLDYCNALLAEIVDTQVKQLQSVQNAAAWLVSGARCRTISHQSCAASTGFRCGGGSFSRPRSLYGNVSWRRTCLSTGSMYTSGECPRSSSFTVYIDWRCGAAESADVSRPAEFQLPGSHRVEQSAVCSALSLNTFTRQLKTDLFGQ